MIKKAALAFSAAFILIGILGFVPALAPAGEDGMPMLLGLFMVDGLHNVIHLTSGIVALAAGLTSEKFSRLYFQIFGVVYALVAIIGLIQGDTVLGILHVNLADNLLHVVIAASALILGFMKTSNDGNVTRVSI